MFDSASNTEVLTMAGTVFSSGIGFDVSDRVHLQQDCLASYDRSSYWYSFRDAFRSSYDSCFPPLLYLLTSGRVGAVFILGIRTCWFDGTAQDALHRFKEMRGAEGF